MSFVLIGFFSSSAPDTLAFKVFIGLYKVKILPLLGECDNLGSFLALLEANENGLVSEPAVFFSSLGVNF